MKDKYTVNTKCGTFKGTSDKNVCVWRGIPYAAAPLGELRFSHAVPAEKGSSTFDATSFASPALQAASFGKPESTNEDCLHLNIWSPGADQHRRPVMFFLHGGSFECGTGSDPEFNGADLSIAGNVVVVTINYRLGVPGFIDFSCIDSSFHPNCGVSDVIAALKWTYENIEGFGGDPENIVAVGQSAGAIMLSALVTMPEAVRYIAKSIMMSTGPTLFKTKGDGIAQAEAFISFTGLDTAEKLRSVSSEKLLALQLSFREFYQQGAGTFSPYIDREYIKYFPIIAANKGLPKKIPLLIGSTLEEMSFQFIKPLAKIIDIEKLFAEGVDREDPEKQQKILEKYKRYGKRANSRMLSDLIFKLGSSWFAGVCGAQTPVWLYSFEYETASMKLSKLHCFHGSDLPFIFRNYNHGLGKVVFSLTPFKTEADKISGMMRRDFFQFAHTGSLDWEPCCDENVPAKAYNTKVSYHQVIEADIMEALKELKYYEVTFDESV